MNWRAIGAVAVAVGVVGGCTILCPPAAKTEAPGPKLPQNTWIEQVPLPDGRTALCIFRTNAIWCDTPVAPTTQPATPQPSPS